MVEHATLDKVTVVFIRNRFTAPACSLKSHIGMVQHILCLVRVIKQQKREEGLSLLSGMHALRVKWASSLHTNLEIYFKGRFPFIAFIPQLEHLAGAYCFHTRWRVLSFIIYIF